MPAQPRTELSIRVTVTGAHAGTYTGASGAPCVDTQDGLVAGYMPAAVEQGLRSLRLVVAGQSPAGSADFTLTFALARMNRTYATYTLEPRNGSGSGTARTMRGGGRATLDVTGTTGDGTRITVRVQCSADGDAPIVDDATASEAAAEQLADSPGDDTRQPPVMAYVDDRAATFAGRIAIGGDGGREALREAIQWAGFGVRDESGTVIVAPRHGWQGIWFDPIDLDLMERSIGVDQRTPLGVIASGFAKLSPGTTEAQVATAMAAGLRAHAAGSNPALRFWARFIGALGDDERGRFAGRADTIGLTPIQAAFLLQRLHADFLIVQRHASGRRTGAMEPAAPPVTRMSGPSAPLEAAPLPRADACKLGDTETLVLDWNAVGTTTAFGQLVDRLLPSAEKYAAAAGHVSFAFSMVKMIGMLATLDVKTGLEGDGPLERTKSTEVPGTERRMVTKLRMPESGNWKVLNCMRPAFNAAGIDFSIADGGPVKDAEVEYQMIDDGTAKVAGRLRTSAGMPIVEWKRGENPTKGHITDDRGETAIWMTGTVQRSPISASARAVEKRGAVRVSVALTRNSMFKDLPGLGGGLVSALTNPAMAAIAMIPEMIMRIPLPKQTVPFRIRDWGDEVAFEVTEFAVLVGDGCPEDMLHGRDIIAGTIPLTRDTTSTATRSTNVPGCGGKPIKVRCPKNRRCTGWDGDDRICQVMLQGTQQLVVTRSIYMDREHGRVLRIRWKLPGVGASQATVGGDCLRSRWGNEFAPDNEFIVTTREEVEGEYHGYRFGSRQSDRRWVGYEDGVVIPFPRNVTFPYSAEAIVPAGSARRLTVVELR